MQKECESCGKTFHFPPNRLSKARFCSKQCYGSGKLGSEENFWAGVLKGNPDECWEWQRARSGGRYGNLKFRDHFIYAHRLAWILTYGPIDDPTMNVLHKCDNPPCCNPTHLWLGTIADNVHDMVAKGRWAKTHPGKKNPMGLHPKARFTHETATLIRERYLNGEKQADLAVEYGVHNNTISKIVLGRRYKGSFHQDKQSGL